MVLIPRQSYQKQSIFMGFPIFTSVWSLSGRADCGLIPWLRWPRRSCFWLVTICRFISRWSHSYPEFLARSRGTDSHKISYHITILLESAKVVTQIPQTLPTFNLWGPTVKCFLVHKPHELSLYPRWRRGRTSFSQLRRIDCDVLLRYWLHRRCSKIHNSRRKLSKVDGNTHISIKKMSHKSNTHI